MGYSSGCSGKQTPENISPIAAWGLKPVVTQETRFATRVKTGDLQTWPRLCKQSWPRRNRGIQGLVSSCIHFQYSNFRHVSACICFLELWMHFHDIRFHFHGVAFAYLFIWICEYTVMCLIPDGIYLYFNTGLCIWSFPTVLWVWVYDSSPSSCGLLVKISNNSLSIKDECLIFTTTKICS